MTTKTCTNGHIMTGIGFGECPECEAPWIATPTVEDIVSLYKQNFSPLVDVTGFYDEHTKEEYRPSPRDKKIMDWLRTTYTTYGQSRFEAGEREGKAYWEPAEVHKNVWREEGAKAERERIIQKLDNPVLAGPESISDIVVASQVNEMWNTFYRDPIIEVIKDSASLTMQSDNK